MKRSNRHGKDLGAVLGVVLGAMVVGFAAVGAVGAVGAGLSLHAHGFWNMLLVCAALQAKAGNFPSKPAFSIPAHVADSMSVKPAGISTMASGFPGVRLALPQT